MLQSQRGSFAPRDKYSRLFSEAAMSFSAASLKGTLLHPASSFSWSLSRAGIRAKAFQFVRAALADRSAWASEGCAIAVAGWSRAKGSNSERRFRYRIKVL